MANCLLTYNAWIFIKGIHADKKYLKADRKQFNKEYKSMIEKINSVADALKPLYLLVHPEEDFENFNEDLHDELRTKDCKMKLLQKLVNKITTKVSQSATVGRCPDKVVDMTDVSHNQ